MANSDQLSQKPSTASWTILGIAVVATIASAIVGFEASDPALARFVQGIVTPLLAVVTGFLIADLYYRTEASKKVDQNVGQSAYATMVTLQGMMDVDKQLAAASNDLHEGNRQEASNALTLALTISRLTLRHAFQALRETENVSSQGVAQAKTDFATAETAAQPERQKIQSAGRPANYTVGVGNA